jgi:hypothetical protein
MYAMNWKKKRGNYAPTRTLNTEEFSPIDKDDSYKGAQVLCHTFKPVPPVFRGNLVFMGDRSWLSVNELDRKLRNRI